MADRDVPLHQAEFLDCYAHPDGPVLHLARVRVAGGWLYSSVDESGLVFVPDPAPVSIGG